MTGSAFCQQLLQVCQRVASCSSHLSSATNQPTEVSRFGGKPLANRGACRETVENSDKARPTGSATRRSLRPHCRGIPSEHDDRWLHNQFHRLLSAGMRRHYQCLSAKTSTIHTRHGRQTGMLATHIWLIAGRRPLDERICKRLNTKLCETQRPLAILRTSRPPINRVMVPSWHSLKRGWVTNLLRYS